MFDEPEDDPQQQRSDPATRAKDKSDEFRMHAELASVFEGHRKFDAEILPKLDAEIARDAQKTIARLEKNKVEGGPIISTQFEPEAVRLLDLPSAQNLSTNDYHIYRRPGEVMILRWLAGEQVDSFYTRLQAHFDAALKQYTEDQEQSYGWKQDPEVTAYLKALKAIDMKMADKYVRDVIRQHKIFILSTQTVDEMDILHLCDFIIGIPSAEIVGEASAPPDEPTEQDRAWFFKLFSLRGMNQGTEQMFFFAYLQKSDGF